MDWTSLHFRSVSELCFGALALCGTVRTMFSRAWALHSGTIPSFIPSVTVADKSPAHGCWTQFCFSHNLRVQAVKRQRRFLSLLNVLHFQQSSKHLSNHLQILLNILQTNLADSYQNSSKSLLDSLQITIKHSPNTLVTLQ